MAIPKISQHNIFNSYSHPSLSLSFLSSFTHAISLPSSLLSIPLSFHFLIGIPIPPAVLLSLSLIRVLFLFSIELSQYPALFPSAHSVLELCRSLSRFLSQLAPLVLSPPPPVPSIPRSLLRTSARSLPCSEHHDSPPELTSPLSLSYSRNASN
jgi:hypothetical protein